jgi:GMP synthase-like glutamine amidotransferase
MSAALGGSVRRAARPEYGWTTISSNTHHIAEGPWFQFHHDEFTLPEEAIELARNDSGIQAFRTGRSLATQFHPEMSGDLLASWCQIESGAEELISAGHDPGRLIEESRAKALESQPALEQMLDWFLEEIAG